MPSILPLWMLFKIRLQAPSSGGQLTVSSALHCFFQWPCFPFSFKYNINFDGPSFNDLHQCCAHCQTPICKDAAFLCSSVGLLRALALDTLRRRAAQLPGLLDDLRPELSRALGHHNDAIQAAALHLLAELLPREPDERAGLPLHCLSA